MKFLIDTNVFIPLEPLRVEDREGMLHDASQLVKLALESRYQIFLHPSAMLDLARDKNVERRQLREQLFNKYPQLPDPPPLPQHLADELGEAERGSNDWVDHQHVAALYASAIDFLVTEDRKLRKKARRVGLGDRVLTVVEALGVISDLAAKTPAPPPAVRSVVAHAIDPRDPILESFRGDYPDFDKWFDKCRREHRQSWIIDGDGGLAALAIVHPEKQSVFSLHGSILKLCSFKVSDRCNGFKYGELLLKAVFDYVAAQAYDWLYVTVFPKHSKLVELFDVFGFRRLTVSTHLGEDVMVKGLRPECDSSLPDDPLLFHIRYGPRLFRADVPWFLVPIQPQFSDLLFPETSVQPHLFPGRTAYGNAIRKAYLSNSPIRTIVPGAILAFYRSHVARGIVALGVLEEAIVSDSAEEIARRVGKRTVYSLVEIQALCKRHVVALLFRHCRTVKPVLTPEQLEQMTVFRRPPQSVMQIKEKGLAWIRKTLAA